MFDYQKVESYREHVLSRLAEYEHADEELMQNVAWAFSSACFIADGKKLDTEETLALCKERTKSYTDNYYGDYIDIE